MSLIKAIKVFAVTALLVITANSLHAADKINDRPDNKSGYNPCFVRPVILHPAISQPLINRAEVIPPKVLSATTTQWFIQRTDIEPPHMILPVVVQPQWDGCSHQINERFKQATVLSGMKPIASSGQQPKNGAIAARVFTDASACCGQTVGGR